MKNPKGVSLLETYNNIKVSTKQVIKLTQKWQKRLNLQNWEIVVYVIPLEEFNTLWPDFAEEVQACNQFFIEHQCSSIYVKAVTIEPLELLIIHELVHLVVADMDELASDMIGDDDFVKCTHERYLEKAVQALTHAYYTMETTS